MQRYNAGCPCCDVWLSGFDIVHLDMSLESHLKTHKRADILRDTMENIIRYDNDEMIGIDEADEDSIKRKH